MTKRPPLTHLSAILLGLALLAAGAWWYTNADDPVRGIPETPIVEDAPTGQAACEAAGGVWNECASACPPDAEACILMCVQKCEGLGEGEAVVEAFFPNSELDPGHLDCAKVFPVRRAIRTDGGPAAREYGTLEGLLRGPTEAEREAGYFSSLPDGVRVIRISNDGSRFEVDFSAELAKVAGSCRVESIRSQIETTVKTAFPDVKEVVIAIEGVKRGEELQP